MKNNLFLVFLAFLLSYSASSQESHLVISASGGDVYNTSGSISTSIGQIVYTSSSNSIGAISHGVEQANKSMVSLTVNLNVFLDGYYKNNSSPALMRPARYTNLLESGSLNPGAASDVDLITVELIRPSNLNAVAYSATSILQTNGTVRCNFPTNSLFGSYYIVVKHRAAIPIWSANPITLSAATTYNFSNNLANVYSGGDVSVPTMHTINSGLYGMWMGEMIDDDYLDAVDYASLETDINLSQYGGLYLLDGDLNGDSYVDATDFGSVFDYNSNQGVYTHRPF